MKPLIPILAVAITSLAVASVQFARQAAEHRQRAETEVVLRQKQEVRIAELERAQNRLRQELLEARAAPAPVAAAPVVTAPPNVPPPANRGAQADSGSFIFGRLDGPGDAAQRVPAARPREIFESPAAVNFMRTRMKQSLRRQYQDVGSELGLTAEQAGELMDLLAEQQTRQVGRQQPTNMDDMQRYLQDMQQKNTAEIAAVIGQEKMDQWRSFQQSLPQRSQLQQFQEQLDATGVPMNESQRRQMLAAITEESQRLPRPQFTAGLPPEEIGTQMNQWQSDYDSAVLDRARGVLSTEQYKSLKEYQDYQAEMRKSFAAGAPVRFSFTGDSSGAMVPSVGAVSNAVVLAAPTVALPPPPPADR